MKRLATYFPAWQVLFLEVLILAVVLVAGPGEAFAGDWLNVDAGSFTKGTTVLDYQVSSITGRDVYGTGTKVTLLRSVDTTATSTAYASTYSRWTVPSIMIDYSGACPTLSTDGSGFVVITTVYDTIEPSSGSSCTWIRQGVVNGNFTVTGCCSNVASAYSHSYPGDNMAYFSSGDLSLAGGTTDYVGLSGIRPGVEQVTMLFAAYREGGVSYWRRAVLRQHSLGSAWGVPVSEDTTGSTTAAVTSSSAGWHLLSGGYVQGGINDGDKYKIDSGAPSSITVRYRCGVSGQYTRNYEIAQAVVQGTAIPSLARGLVPPYEELSGEVYEEDEVVLGELDFLDPDSWLDTVKSWFEGFDVLFPWVPMLQDFG